MPETVHAQTVANGGRAPFSVVVPGSRLPFFASGRFSATVVTVDSEAGRC